MAASSSASRTVVTSAAYAGSAVLRVWTVRQGVGMHGRSRARAAAGRRRRRRHAPRFRAADLRVTTKPDRSPVTDADTAAEEVLRALIAAERPGDAVLGEEGGGSVADAGRRLGARPDRRHEELLPRHARVGDVDRVDGRRHGDGRRRERARAGSAVVGRGRARARGRRTRRAGGPADRGVRGRRARRRLPVDDGPARVRRGSPGPVARACATRCGRRARSATSGSTSSWPRGCWTWRSTRWRTRGTWPRSRPSSRRREAGSPTSPAPTTWAGGDALTTNGVLHDAARAVIGR